MLVTLNKSYVISAGFGVTSHTHKNPHTGIDLVMPEGTDVLSPVEGTVSRILDYGDANIGKMIAVKLKNGSELIFGHLSEFHAQVGDKIQIGQKIAESGNTGHSTGAHLHLALKTPDGKFVDPSIYEKAFQQVASHSESGGWFSDKWDAIQEFNQNMGEVVGYFKRVVNEGFFDATFPNFVFTDWIAGIFKNTVHILANNANDFFLLPSFLFFIAYLIIGKNKTTSWIIPLIFLYFCFIVFQPLL